MDKDLIKKFWKRKEGNRVIFIERGIFYDFLLRHNMIFKFIKDRCVYIAIIDATTLYISKNNGLIWTEVDIWDFDYNINKRLLTFKKQKTICGFKYWKNYKIRNYRFTNLEVEGMVFTDANTGNRIAIRDQQLYVKEVGNDDFILTSKTTWDAFVDMKGSMHFVWINDINHPSDIEECNTSIAIPHIPNTNSCGIGSLVERSL